jgi:hypothetical protein
MYENTTNPRATASAPNGSSENRPIIAGSQFLTKFATSVQQIITQLSEGVSEKDKIKIVTKMIINKIK